MKHLSHILAITLLLGASALVSAQESINETRDVPPDSSVHVENIAGTLEFSEWDSNRVEVTGTLGKGTERLDFDVNNSRTTIRVILKDGVRSSRGSDLMIRVPSGTRLSAETVSANITIKKLSGRLELESVSGTVNISGEPAELEAETVSGSIKIEFAPPNSEISSVSGHLVVRSAAGHIELGTVSGDIDLTASSLDGVEVETVSGKAQVTTNLLGTGRFELESVSGSVTLTIPRDAAADFDLSTFSGKIRNQIGPQAEKTSRYAPGETVKFSTGNGGPRVTMASFSGTVKLVVR